MVAAARVSRVSRFVLWLAFGWISAGAPVFKIHFARGAEMNGSSVIGKTFLQQMCLDGVERLLAVALVVLLACVSSFSQANLGRIAGTITDQTGGAMSGVTVTVTDTERGVSRALTTDEAGAYNAPNLTPGSYTVRAEAKGFKTAARAGILLETGRELRVDLSLQPGEQAQTIVVTSETPMVETTNATLGGTLSNETINELPLNGRNYQNLLSLRPGVMLFPGGGAYTQSANGSRAEDIGYLLDGLRGDEAYTGQSVLNAPIAAGDASTSLPIDAIQEFNTEENPKAEFGWKPGAIVNAGLKSGTNTIHGSAFAFGRDTALDARNFFDQSPLPKAPVSLEQFGSSLGGAIKKDKLFYFVAYEGQRYSVGSTYQTTTPVTCAGGSAGCGLTSNNTGKSLVDACNSINNAHIANSSAPPVSLLSAQISGLTFSASPNSCAIRPPNYSPGPSESFFPANMGTSPVGGPTTVILGLVSNNHQDNGVAKIDYHINEKQTLSGMYFKGEGGGIWNDGAYEVGLPGSSNSPWMSNLFGSIQMASGAWTWTPNSTLVNEFRVGYDHFNQQYVSVDSNVPATAYGINTGVTDPKYYGFPFVRFVGFNVRLGGNWPKFRGPDGSLQILEHVSVLRGKHAFKFGGEIIQNTAVPFVTASGKGTIRFKNLTGFVAGQPRTNGTESALLAGEPLRHYSNEQYAAFLQDDWRITPRLTMNLGVRYEIITVLKEANNQLGNFDPVKGLIQVGYGETAAYSGDHNNFSPRLGLAWDVQGNGKTVIRAGGSVMYEQLPFNVFDNVANVLGLSQVPTGASIVVNGVTTPGIGNMQVATITVSGNNMNFSGSSLTPAFGGTGTTTVYSSSALSVQCGDGSLNSVGIPATPCNTESIAPNFRTPYVDTWTLNVQRALTNSLSLEVAYVGTHGTKLLGFTDINQPALGAGYTDLTTGDPSTVSASLEQAARPFNSRFPYLAQIDQLSNLDNSNYNGLQVTLTQRPWHGISYNAGYTYSHSIDQASSNWNANPLPPNSYAPGLQRGNSDFDLRHRFTLGITYNVPGINAPGQMLQGWAINSRVTLQSGLPWTAQDTSNDFAGNGQVNELNSFGQLWNFSGNPGDFSSGPQAIPCYGNTLCGNGTSIPAACITAATNMGGNTLAALNAVGGCYMQGSSVLIPPALGTIGNAGRNIFRDSGFKNWDLSVTKVWKIKERLTTQFRAEFFNVLNHADFANPGGPAGAGYNDPSSPSSFGCGCNTPDQVAPNPVLGSGGSRSIQLGLKLLW